MITIIAGIVVTVVTVTTIATIIVAVGDAGRTSDDDGDGDACENEDENCLGS